MKLILYTILLINCLLLHSTFTVAEPAKHDTQVMRFYTAAPFPLSEVLQARIQEACRRIERKCDVVRVESAQRSLFLANDAGAGDAMRVPHIKKLAPQATHNLVVVPEPIVHIEFNVYTTRNSLQIRGWQSLKGLNNGYRIGAKILEKNIPEHKIPLPDAKRLFRMLNDRRLDTVTEHTIIGDYFAGSFENQHIQRLTPPLVSLPGHILLHKKYTERIPDLVKSIRTMKSDGTFSELKEKILSPE